MEDLPKSKTTLLLFWSSPAGLEQGKFGSFLLQGSYYKESSSPMVVEGILMVQSMVILKL